VKSNEKTITLRIPKDLKTEILAYAERHGTNLTQLTLEYYRQLIVRETRQEAEQI